jgi:uncharacterized metal-binding protein
VAREAYVHLSNQSAATARNRRRDPPDRRDDHLLTYISSIRRYDFEVGVRITPAARRLHMAQEVDMDAYTPDFSLDVQGVKGLCPAGEVYAKQQIEAKTLPVLSCEGPCIRGDIARLAANLVAQEVPTFARACHAETFLVPHSSMAEWVRGAEKSIMIDGCFLKCHGRVLKNLVGEEKVVHIDALPLHKRYNDVFLMEDVPEEERKAVARQVANQIIAKLTDDGLVTATAA